MAGKTEKANCDPGSGVRRPKRADGFPLAIPLSSEIRPETVFDALAAMPGRLWLDSASSLPSRTQHMGQSETAESSMCVRGDLERFSFLTADPIYRIEAKVGGPSPWDEIRRVTALLPSSFDENLPPFQGGVAGLIGYEAGRWLEAEALAGSDREQVDDLPTPTVSLGVYDFVIAFDHVASKCWLICQGLSRESFEKASSSDCVVSQGCGGSRTELAKLRAGQVMELLSSGRPGKVAGRRVAGDQETGELGSRAAACRPSKGRGFQDGNARQFESGRPRESRKKPAYATAISGVWSNFTGRQYRDAVSQIVQRICAGDSFQVNLSQRLTSAVGDSDSGDLYQELRRVNAAPYAGYYDGGEFQVLSSSPEGFLQLRNRHVVTRPIKGTVPRTGDLQRDEELAKDLLGSEKDRAENLMIVDLMRNDLSRVCSDESVKVTQSCQIERFQYVQHLVSVVEADLSDGRDAIDLLMACFPGGSVTGAPKIEAMRTIAELEPHPRGAYCGSLGYLSCGGDADFNILIRTVTVTGEVVQIPVGGGITARSVPDVEEAETWAKARGMLKALPESRERPRQAARDVIRDDPPVRPSSGTRAGEHPAAFSPEGLPESPEKLWPEPELLFGPFPGT